VPTGLGPGAKSPQVRAQEHADKKRQFESRKAQTPGPGSYSPASKGPGAQVASSGKKGGGGSTAAFASKSKRISDSLSKVDEKGDPGAYDPYVLKELAITSKKSASKSMKAGAGSFGARQNRKMPIELMGEATPGPGAYNGDLMMRTGKKANLSAFDTGERMPSSSFKSTSVQRAKSQNTHVPGAGAYTPQHTALEPNKRNPAAGMKAKGQRFKASTSWERSQATEPGPGAYEIEYLRSGSKSSVAGSVGGPQAREVAFQTDSLRELPWDS